MNDVCERLLCVGEFSSANGQVRLIRDFEQKRAEGINAQLVLCGTVVDWDYYEQVASAIDQSDYWEDIHLFLDKSPDFLAYQRTLATRIISVPYHEDGLDADV